MSDDSATPNRKDGPDRGPLAVVGCFTTAERKARGTGIRVFHRDGAPWRAAHRLDGIVNPSFLRADPERGVVYAAHGDDDVVSAYTVDPATGAIAPLGRARSAGRNGVAVALHPSKRFLFVADYADGSVSTLPVASDGSPADATHCLALPGPAGPHRVEQTSSHPHDTVMDPAGRFLLVPDKGLDRVFVLRPEDSTGELTVVSQALLRPGSGPRHIAFHPVLPRAYVVTEIDSMVVSLAWDAAAGVLSPLHVVPALPDSFFGHSTAAEIVVDPSGRFLYLSHRGADLVARFSLDDSGDRPVLGGWVPSNGAEPRFMALSPDGTRLFVANEQSDSIVEFAIDAVTGELSATHTVATPSPSAVAFL
ncbi:lactonase family protein [Streptomyces sp. 8L]|uniref:lactonase family protein n=1 Tax=Streptomyces sp. 8L TaxID=2877242 RepID=UPI001CD7C8B5|nr:lactonase family protein [Streptomyces sp. 8L]MCA1216945.1 lactonase family protein [Streptomyces sp. 8L]